MDLSHLGINDWVVLGLYVWVFGLTLAMVYTVTLNWRNYQITKSQVLHNRKLMLEMASDMLALTIASTLEGSPERKQVIDTVNQFNERSKDLLRQMERAGVKTK